MVCLLLSTYSLVNHDGFDAAAKVLKARESKLPGTVLLLFQPAEEGGAGGKFMVDEGIMEGVLGVHGIHVWPHLPSGTISTRVSANQLISATSIFGK